MSADAPGRIVAVSVPPPVLHALHERAAERVVAADQVDDAVAAIAEGPATVDAVAYGATAGAAIEAAQRVRFVDADVGVVLLGDDDELTRWSSALQFTPFLPEDITCKTTSYAGIAADAVIACAERTHRRRTHRATMRSAAARLGSRGATSSDIGQQILGTLVQQAPVAILTLDAARRIASANPYAAELLGIPGGELIGEAVDVLVGSRGRAALHEALDSAARGTGAHVEVTDTAAGNRQPLRVSANRFEAGPGEIGTVLVFQPYRATATAADADADRRQRCAERLRADVIALLDAARRELLEGRPAEAAATIERARDHARAVVTDLASPS